MSRLLKSLFPFVNSQKHKRELLLREEAIKECLNKEHTLIGEILEIVDMNEQNQLSAFSLRQSILKVIYRRLEEKHD